MKVKHNVFFVTGGGSGLGLATVHELVKLGAYVAGERAQYLRIMSKLTPDIHSTRLRRGSGREGRQTAAGLCNLLQVRCEERGGRQEGHQGSRYQMEGQKDWRGGALRWCRHGGQGELLGPGGELDPTEIRLTLSFFIRRRSETMASLSH